MAELIGDRLRRRVREQGSAPLITYYDLDSGARTELSAVTFGNWTDKTANLAVDELMLDQGDRVELAVAVSHPGHWVTLAWALACWQIGVTVTVGRPAGARVVVCGPDWRNHQSSVELVACSLHPLGLGFAETLPPGVLDYSLEVRGQPDAYAAVRQSGLAPAWHDDERVLTQADLVDAGPASAQRRLVRPGDPWDTVSAALVGPLLDGGSSVVVAGPADPARLARIRADERVSSTSGAVGTVGPPRPS